MFIQESEIHQVELVPPGTSPNYNKENPISKLTAACEAVELSAERNFYLVDSLQYLFPYARTSLYGPSGQDWQNRDPRTQDNKNDFQKQNIRGFDFADTRLIRGYARVDGWTGPFLHLSYQPSIASPLANGGAYLGSSVRLFLKVGAAQTSIPVEVPYNTVTHRYEVELWGFPGTPTELGAQLGLKGRAALERGELQLRPDLIRGNLGDFQGPAFDLLRDQARASGSAVQMFDYASDHSMHPVRSLHIELAWGSAHQDLWDSQGGANFHYEFSMVMRGWRNYLGIGQSTSPHGGVGILEYRNLFSNYFGYEAQRQQVLAGDWLPELGRDLEAWNYDAYGRKNSGVKRESFMPVNYMDLHVLKPSCAIGVHRHRDNLEAFLMLHGRALMVVGDWCKFSNRERALEIRTMQPGDLVMIRGGQFHGLINSLDENVELFMFGGYD